MTNKIKLGEEALGIYRRSIKDVFFSKHSNKPTGYFLIFLVMK